MTGLATVSFLLAALVQQTPNLGGGRACSVVQGPRAESVRLLVLTEGDESHFLTEIIEELEALTVARTDRCMLTEVINGNLFEMAGGTQYRLQTLVQDFGGGVTQVPRGPLRPGADILTGVNRFLLISSGPVSDLIELQFALFDRLPASDTTAPAGSVLSQIRELSVPDPIEPTRTTSVILDPGSEARRSELHNAIGRLFPASNAPATARLRVEGRRVEDRETVVVGVGDTIRVDGLASTDPDAPRIRLKYRWTQGPPEWSGEVRPEDDLGVPAVTDSIGTVAVATPREGEFWLSLQVDDGVELSDLRTVRLVGVPRPELRGALPARTVRARASRSSPLVPKSPEDADPYIGTLRVTDASGEAAPRVGDMACVLVEVGDGDDAMRSQQCHDLGSPPFVVGPVEIAPSFGFVDVSYVALSRVADYPTAPTTTRGQLWIERGLALSDTVPFSVMPRTQAASRYRLATVATLVPGAPTVLPDSVTTQADRKVEWSVELSSVLFLWRRVSVGAGLFVTDDGLESPFWELTVPLRFIDRLGVRSTPFNRLVSFVAEVELFDGLVVLGAEAPGRGRWRFKIGADVRPLVTRF